MGMTIQFEMGKGSKDVRTVGAEVIGKDEEVKEVPTLEPKDLVAEDKKGELKPVEDFTKKDDLEAYGKEFGIDLNKTKTISNMYADLVAHVAK